MAKKNSTLIRPTIIAEVKQFYSEIQYEEEARMQRYVRNLLYLTGDQWLLPNKGNEQTQYSGSADYGWMPQPVTNKVLQAYQINQSKLSKVFPDYLVHPNSQEEDDRAAAEVAQGIIEYSLDYNEEKLKTIKKNSWRISLGDVFAKRFWSDEVNEFLEIPKYKKIEEDVEVLGYRCTRCGFEFKKEYYEPNSVCPECGATEAEFPPEEDYISFIEEREEPDGFDYKPIENLLLHIVPPQDIKVPYHATSIDDTPKLVHQKLLHKDKIEQIASEFGVEYKGGGEAEEIDNYLSTPSIANILNRGLGDLYQYKYSGNPTKHKDLQRYVEYYERPSKKYKDGYFAVLAGNQVLYERGKCRDIPFFQHRWVRIVDSFWSVGMIDNCYRQQDRINALDAAIVLNRKLNIFAKWMYPKNSLDTPPSANPADPIEYNPMDEGKPEPVKLPGLSVEVYKEREIAERDFDLASFTSSVNAGMNPKGVYAGVSLEILREESDTPLNGIVLESELTHQKELKYILEQFQKNVSDERIIRIVGRNMERQVFNFKGADIKGNTDVRVILGSSIPESIARKQEKVMGLAQSGLLGDVVNNQRKSNALLEVFNLSKDFQEAYNRQRDMAMNENHMIIYQKKFDFNVGLVMQPPLVLNPRDGKPFKTLTDFDDDRVHYEEHSNKIIAIEFKKLDEEVQEFMVLHANEHKIRMMVNMAQKAGQQQSAPTGK